jgi:hypothetical protein
VDISEKSTFLAFAGKCDFAYSVIGVVTALTELAVWTPCAESPDLTVIYSPCSKRISSACDLLAKGDSRLLCSVI